MTISAGALIGGSLIAGGSALASKLIEKRRYERQLADQHKLWQENNQYNSPRAQMARLKAAGLNPNLVYQNGGATTPSDQISPPDFQTSPINEFNSVIPNAYQAASIEADVANKQAITADLLASKRVKDTPLGQLEEYNQLTDSTKRALADAFGVDYSQLPSLSMRFMATKHEYENMAHTSSQLKKFLDILNSEKDTAASQALSAHFQSLVDYMAMNSEAKSRGYKVEQVASFPFTTIRGIVGKEGFDYAAGSTIQMYYNLLNQVNEGKWENTGFRRGVRTFSDILGGVGSVLPGIGNLLKKPTSSPSIRSVETHGYDKKRGSWYQSQHYNY